MVGEWESDRVFLMLGPGGGEDGGTRLLPLLAARRESEMGRTAVAVGVVVVVQRTPLRGLTYCGGCSAGWVAG